MTVKRIAIFLYPYSKREDSSDCGGMSTPGHGQGVGPDGDKWSLDHAGYVGRGRSEAKRNGVLRNHYYPTGAIQNERR